MMKVLIDFWLEDVYQSCRLVHIFIEIEMMYRILTPFFQISNKLPKSYVNASLEPWRIVLFFFVAHDSGWLHTNAPQCP